MFGVCVRCRSPLFGFRFLLVCLYFPVFSWFPLPGASKLLVRLVGSGVRVGSARLLFSLLFCSGLAANVSLRVPMFLMFRLCCCWSLFKAWGLVSIVGFVCGCSRRLHWSRLLTYSLYFKVFCVFWCCAFGAGWFRSLRCRLFPPGGSVKGKGDWVLNKDCQGKGVWV